jgi:hypothetical protein
MPAKVLVRALPKYTNAYVSGVVGFDYHEGIAVLGTAGVSDEVMLRVRARDPLMFQFLDFTQPEWFDYRQLLQDYANEIQRLDRLGVLVRDARTDAR